MTNWPLMPVARTSVVPPLLRPISPFVTATVMRLPSAGLLGLTCCCWKLKLPLSVCVTPPSVSISDTFDAFTSTNLPAGRFSVTDDVPTVKLSLTGLVVVLIATVKVPLSATLGTFSAAVAVRLPARPPDMSRKSPLPFVTDSRLLEPSPSVRLTPLAPTCTTG